MAARPLRQEGRGFLNCQHKDADGTLATYGLFLPHAYDDRRPWPLILFLHGAGETGDDGQRQMEVGLGPAVRRREGRFPSLVVFPQSQLRTWQADTPDARRALTIVGNVRKKFNVDASRIYLTGLSMGGFGVWSLAARHPRRWAALVPVCGGGNPKNAGKIKAIPCWCFHGARDEVVPAQRSREMTEALRAAGGRPKYTEYESVGHNSWDPAYAHRGLFAWLFKQRRKA
jgi:predicted peptidase